MSSSDSAIAGPARPRGLFILRFWRGEVALGVSFWVVYILLSIVIAKVLALVEDSTLVEATYDPRQLFFFHVGRALLIVPIAIWQFVGVWRSALVYRAMRRREGRWALLAYLAWAMVLFGAANLGFILVAKVRPQLVEYYRSAFLGDPEIPAYGFRAMRDGTEVEIVGGFKYGLVRDFETFVADKPRLRIVHLDSVGGRVGEAENLYRVLKARGLETYVAAGCYSACTLAYAAGARRWLGPDGKLGFHAPRFPGAESRDLFATERGLYLAAGIEPAFLARAFATIPPAIWTPSRQELLDGHVVTDLATDDTFADSGAGQTLDRESWAARLRKEGPLLDALATSRPDLFAPLAAASLKAYVDGASQRAVERILSEGDEKAVETMLPGADDATLVDYAKLVIDEYAILLGKSPDYCYLFGTGQAQGWEFEAKLGPAMVRRESALQLRAVGRHAAPPSPPQAELAAAKAHFQSLIKETAAPDDLKALATTPRTSADKTAYCRGLIGVYKAALRMPPEETGMVLRDLLAQP